MDIFLAGASQLGTIFQQRCHQLATQKQPRTAKPSKAAPQKGPQKQNDAQRSDDKQDAAKGAEGVSQGQSRIMQGVQQADMSRADQQQLRHQVYGSQNKDVAFNKAAKAIAS